MSPKKAMEVRWGGDEAVVGGGGGGGEVEVEVEVEVEGSDSEREVAELWF